VLHAIGNAFTGSGSSSATGHTNTNTNARGGSSGLVGASSSGGGTSNLSAPSWRHFPFFDAVPVYDVNTPAPEASSSTQTTSPPDESESEPKLQPQAPTLLQSPLEISTIHSGRIGSGEIVVVADIHGSAHVVDKHWESVLSWVCFSGGRVTHIVSGGIAGGGANGGSVGGMGGVLITIGVSN
jgi:hypothetical protein